MVPESRSTSFSSTSTGISSSSYHEDEVEADDERHSRRTSSVSFADEDDVLEFIKGEMNNRNNIWYTPEELSAMRQRYRLQEDQKQQEEEQLLLQQQRHHHHHRQRRFRSSSPPPLSPPSSSSLIRKRCRDVVFGESANQILEYGEICDVERLALQYKQASEASKIDALSRGYSDAANAWATEEC